MNKMKWILSILLIFALTTTAFPIESFANSAEPAGESCSGYFIKVKDSAAHRMQLKGSGLYSDGVEAVAGLPGVYLAETLEDLEAFTKGLEIEYIEPNYKVELFAIPNDPIFKGKDAIFLLGYLEFIHTDAAWDSGMDGEGSTIAIIDSGLFTGHVDFNADKLLDGHNYIDNSGDITDNLGHGTFVTSIIAAQTNNNMYIAGVADSASILPLKCFETKDDGTIENIVNAINDAVASGADVINMSFGSATYSRVLEEAVNAAAQAGILLIAAVGNDGTSTLYYPAAYDAVIGVGAVEFIGTIPNFSQKNTSVFVVAPGAPVYGLTPHMDTIIVTTGTSYAAPYVSGMAAIAKQVDSDISIDSFKKLLLRSSTDNGAPGYDTSYGWGMVNMKSFIEQLHRTYTITYVTSGGVFTAPPPETYTVTSDAITFPSPERENSLFAGWYEAPDYQGEPVTGLPAGSVDDITLYARWADNTPPSVVPGSENQFGTASPASLDGKTAAVPYIANAASWFTERGDNDLSLILESSSAAGPVGLKGSTIEFTPAYEDAGQVRTIKVKAKKGSLESGAVTLAIDVDTLPVSHSQLTPKTARFDKNPQSSGYGDISVELTLYGNTLTGILKDHLPLAENTQYIGRMEENVQPSDRYTVILKKDYLESLNTGDTAFTFTFDKGDPAVLTLTVSQSDSQGSNSGNGSSTGGGGDPSPAGPPVPVAPPAASTPAPEQEETIASPEKFSLFINGRDDEQLSAWVNPFGDVNKSDWFYDAVRFANFNGLFSGISLSSYSPHTSATRGMFVAVLARMSHIAPELYTLSPFADVTGREWYGPSVIWAYEKGLTAGLGESTFGPDADITREQMMVILYHFAQFYNINTETRGEVGAFTDRNTISGWATEAMSWSVGLGLLFGDNDGRLNPQSKATRAETSAILQRFAEKAAADFTN